MSRRTDVVRTQSMTSGVPGARSLGGLPKAWCFDNGVQFNIDFGEGPLPPVEGLTASGDTSSHLGSGFQANACGFIRNYEHDADGVTLTANGVWLVDGRALETGWGIVNIHMEAESIMSWAVSCLIPAGDTAGFALSIPVFFEGECGFSCSFVEVDLQTNPCCDFPPPGG